MKTVSKEECERKGMVFVQYHNEKHTGVKSFCRKKKGRRHDLENVYDPSIHRRRESEEPDNPEIQEIELEDGEE